MAPVTRSNSLGRSLLLEHLQRSRRRRADLASLIGVSAAVVSLWCTGLRRPNRRNAAALEDVAGIPARAWAAERVDEVAQ